MNWNDLSMANRANIIKLGVESGITDLNTIKNRYNSFAKGGYTKWKEAIKAYKNIDIDNDDTYDYEGFYNSNPDRAWDMMNETSDAHFTDEFKTSLHPSFSNESRYSGYKNEFNPSGIEGGTWYDDSNYQLSQDQFDNDWDTDRTINYFDYAEPNSVNLFAPNSSQVLRGITVTPKGAYPARRYDGGGVVVRDRRTGKDTPFNTRQEADDYISANYEDPNFYLGDLDDLIVVGNRPLSVEDINITPINEADNTAIPEYIFPEYYEVKHNYDGYSDAEKNRYLRRIEHSGLSSYSMRNATRDIIGDRIASEYNPGSILGGLATPMNALSPSQQVGAIIDWAQGEKGYWEGIGGGNSGFFTEKFAEEHPDLTLAGNMAADFGLGLIGIDAIELAANRGGLKFIPTTMDLRRAHGKFEVGQPIKLSDYLSPEELSRVTNFNKDIRRRLINALSDEGYIMTNTEQDLAQDITNKVNYYIDAPSDDGIVAISNNSDGSIGFKINKLDEEAHNFSKDEVIIHENEHSQRRRLMQEASGVRKQTRVEENNTEQGPFFINKKDGPLERMSKHMLNKENDSRIIYTKMEMEALDDAYTFTNARLEKQDIYPILEKGATNRQLRFNISKKYGDVIGKELDEVIDNMSDIELLDMMRDTNGYSKDFYKQFGESNPNMTVEAIRNKANAIRKALKYVAYNSDVKENNSQLDTYYA